MLIIVPTEVGFDKGRLPWLTLLIAALTMLFFLLFQFNESEKEEQIYDFYTKSELFSLEVDHFNDYLKTPRALQQYVGIKTVDTEQPERIFYMAFDRDFRKYLEAQFLSENTATDQKNDDLWYSLTLELERKKNTLYYYKWGAKSNDLSASSLVLHALLHGGLGHLMGNMIFLLLFGLGVERLYGKLLYLTIYIVSAMVSGFVFSVLDGKPFISLIGASGAISGLMGAYVSYFGLQKIRFFAWFAIYFNHYKWPAALVLVFWIAKELFGQFTDAESNTAYLAHFGGLLAGALLGFLLKPRNTRKTNQHTEIKQSHYQTALELIRKLEFDQARTALLNELNSTPDHLGALKSLFNIDKTKPAHENYKQTINRIFSFNLTNQSADEFILKIARDSLSKTITIRELTIDALFNLSLRLLRNNQLETASPLIQHAKKNHTENIALPKLLFKWGQALFQNGKNIRARDELVYLANYYAETSFGQEAQKALKQKID